MSFRLKKIVNARLSDRELPKSESPKGTPSPMALRIKSLERQVELFKSKSFSESSAMKAAHTRLRASLDEISREVRKLESDRQAAPKARIEAKRHGSLCFSIWRRLRKYFDEKIAEERGISLQELHRARERGHTKEDLRKPDDPNDRREPEKGLKDEEMRAQIYAKVAETSGQPLAKLWASLVAPVPTTELKPIPTEPPAGQLYDSRPNKSQSAPEFIAAVYKDFLHGDFTRADLRRLDPKAAMALSNWERDHGQRAEINLPTKKELNDRLLQTPAEELTPHERVAQKRILSDRANNERRRTKKPR